MRIPTSRSLLVLLLMLVAALLLGACGGGDDDKPATKKADTTERAAGIRGNDAGDAAGQAEGTLRIRLEHVGDKASGAGIPVPAGIACSRSLPATCNGTIECPAPLHDSTQLANVCTWLSAFGKASLVADKPEREACTQIYGGPEVATVTGTIDGEKIDATFSRQNGCEINRFDMVAPLWTGEVPASLDPSGGGAAAGACPVIDPDAPVSSDDAKGGSNADDTSCAVPTEPEVISDPPEAFDY